MEQRVLARLRRLRRPGCRPPLLSLGPPVLGQSEVMAFCLEHRPSLLEQRDTLRLRNPTRPREVERAEPHRGSGSCDSIARRSRFREDLEGALVCRLLVHVRKLRRVRESSLVILRENGGGPLEERACRAGVTAVEGSAARRGEVLRCAAGEAEQLGGFRVELPAVAVRLLEVVAEDLVALDELLAVEASPRTARAVRSRRLRQRLVRRIADQQMAEAEALVHRKRRWCRADQLLAHERGEMRFHAAPNRGRQRRDRAAMEHLALDRPSLHDECERRRRARRCAPGGARGSWAEPRSPRSPPARAPSRASPRHRAGCPRGVVMRSRSTGSSTRPDRDGR